MNEEPWREEYRRRLLKVGNTQANRTNPPAECVDPCLAKREPGEPMFVLLARDSAAPTAMEHWCYERYMEIATGERTDSDEEVEHIEAVRGMIAQFREWRKANRG